MNKAYGRIVKINRPMNEIVIQLSFGKYEPRLAEMVSLELIGSPVYITGQDEDGRPVWDLSAPENQGNPTAYE